MDTEGAPVGPLGHVVVVTLVLVPPLYPAPQAALFVTDPAVHVIGWQVPGFVTVVVATAVPVEHEYEVVFTPELAKATVPEPHVGVKFDVVEAGHAVHFDVS